MPFDPTDPTWVAIPDKQVDSALCVIYDAALGKFRPAAASDFGGGGGGSTPASFASTTGLAQSLTVADANVLNQVVGYNGHTGDQFVQVFHGTSAVIGNLITVFAVAAQNNFFIDFGAGLSVPSGVHVANSTSPASVVAGGSNVQFTIQYS